VALRFHRVFWEGAIPPRPQAGPPGNQYGRGRGTAARQRTRKKEEERRRGGGKKGGREQKAPKRDPLSRGKIKKVGPPVVPFPKTNSPRLPISTREKTLVRPLLRPAESGRPAGRGRCGKKTDRDLDRLFPVGDRGPFRFHCAGHRRIQTTPRTGVGWNWRSVFSDKGGSHASGPTRTRPEIGLCGAIQKAEIRATFVSRRGEKNGRALANGVGGKKKGVVWGVGPYYPYADWGPRRASDSAPGCLRRSRALAHHWTPVFGRDTGGIDACRTDSKRFAKAPPRKAMKRAFAAVSAFQQRAFAFSLS